MKPENVELELVEEALSPEELDTTAAEAEAELETGAAVVGGAVVCACAMPVLTTASLFVGFFFIPTPVDRPPMTFQRSEGQG